MTRELILALFDSGLVQIGRFQGADGAPEPMRADFALLPSYPEVAKSLTALCAGRVLPAPDLRLCCALDMLGMGVLMSGALAVPLVYAVECEDAEPKSFIGAYDIDHPAVLIWSAQWKAPSERWTKLMAHVGLTLTQTLYVAGDGTSLLPVSTILETLAVNGRISAHAADSTAQWAAARMR